MAVVGRTRYWIQISTVDVINIAADRQKFMTLTGELKVDSAWDDQPFQGYGCARQNLNGSHDLTTPLSGCLTIRGLAIATGNLPTKFEVSISTHYEIMKDDTKSRKWGGLG